MIPLPVVIEIQYSVVIEKLHIEATSKIAIFELSFLYEPMHFCEETSNATRIYIYITYFKLPVMNISSIQTSHKLL